MLRKLTLAALLTICVLPAPLARADAPGGVMAAIHHGRFAVMAESSLRATLAGWSRSAGWTLVWDQESDYRIRASAVFDGSFEEAVIDLVDSIHLDNPELSVVLYRGNRVVHVENRHASGD